MAGLSIAACAIMFLAFQANAHSLTLVVIALAVTSMGMSLSFPAMMVSGQNGAELRDIGIVTSMIAFSRTLGGAFGTAVLWSVVIASLYSGLKISGAGNLGAALLQGGPAAVAHWPEAARHLLHPALIHAYRVAFVICAGIVVCAVTVLVFLREKPLRTEPAFAVRSRAAE
jgi:hypothetical protein